MKKPDRKRINYLGKLARVRSGFGDAPLPAGLPQGATVRIVGFDIGRFDVEYKGKRFMVPMACVENLHQLWN